MLDVSAAQAVGGRVCPMRSIELSIRGMTCAACAARIEKKLNMIDHDVVAAVSFATEKATITAPQAVSAQALVAAAGPRRRHRDLATARPDTCAGGSCSRSFSSSRSVTCRSCSRCSPPTGSPGGSGSW